MKISKVTIFYPRYQKHQELLAIRVYTDEGIYGDGEVANINTGFAAYGMLRDILPMIIGRDPLDHEVIWDDIYKKTFYGQNGGQTFFAALSAIDIALWDIKGKYFNVPIYKLLGGKKRENLRAYASMVMTDWGQAVKGPDAYTPEKFAEYAKNVVKMGYDSLKVDFLMLGADGRFLSENERTGLLPATTVAMYVDRVAAVREAIGPNVDLIIEGHGFLDALSSVQLARAVEKYNIFYFEEPCTPTPIAIKSVSDQVNIPIATGERIISRWEVMPYLETRSIKVLQPDIGNQGGFTETKKVCDAAYAYDVGIQLHACGTHLAIACALHLGCAIPNFIIHEQHRVAWETDYTGFTTKTFQPVNGYIDIPEEPGLGVEWSDIVLNWKDQVTIE